MSNQSDGLTNLSDAFRHPMAEFSPVPIWWWSGDRLERKRLRWQLEQFVAGGIHNLVVLNLAPTGPLFGSDPDDPPFLSEAWWQIFRDVCSDARELGVRLWFYDQIGFSGANLQAGLVRDTPTFAGQWLGSAVIEGIGRLELDCPTEGEPLAAVVTWPGTGVTQTIAGPKRHVVDEQHGLRRFRLVYAVDRGFDYFNPAACEKLRDTIHGEFERRVGDYFGDVIVGSFQDELPPMPSWGSNFLASFNSKNGYDLAKKIGLLWEGNTDEARRVRVDYQATRASLAETAFFKPLFDWHDGHGLVCGFDQTDPTRAGEPVACIRLYADYLKTHRWYGAPGSDHHGDAKIHSSLAHLYHRPRTWIESFHSSGWGGTLEETFDWLIPWLRAGANLYDPHAVYYSTRGGWWEWAPPSTCWRQPYWRHYSIFSGAVSRLCFMLTQGEHVCDIALLYPTTTVQADTTPDGPNQAAQTAHDIYRSLVGRMKWYNPSTGVLDQDRRDYDIIDDDSLQRAEVGSGLMRIGGEQYQAIILPGLVTLEAASVEKLNLFVEKGGLLVAVSPLPETTVGDDPLPMAQLRKLFEAGQALTVASPDALPVVLGRLPRRVDAPVPTLLRKVNGHDILFVPAAAPNATKIDASTNWLATKYDFDPARYARKMTIRIRGTQGSPQLWNPLDGSRQALKSRTHGDTVEVDIPFDEFPAALIVWDGPGEPLPVVEGRPSETILATLGDWQALLEPTMDNRFGDFSLPAKAGEFPVQTWRFEQLANPPGSKDEGSAAVEATYGPYGWWIGPRSNGELPPPAASWQNALGQPGWKPAVYSLQRGISHDPIHMATLGPKGHVPHEFLAFGKVTPGQSVRFRTSVRSTSVQSLYLALDANAAKRAWINGKDLGPDSNGYQWLVPVTLQPGINLVEWELIADSPIDLRAAWALVISTEHYIAPEWLSAPGLPVRDSMLRFSVHFDLSFEPESAVVQIGSVNSASPCRVRVNGSEVGRFGGFDPYEGTLRLQSYATPAFHRGTNQVVVEIHDLGKPLAVLLDARITSHGGEECILVSDRSWRVQRDALPDEQVILRRKESVASQWSIPAADPASLCLWRRPHPLSGVSWLEGDQGDETVLSIVPDAFAQTNRTEWFRWKLPPGVTSIHLPLHGSARIWIDGVELPIHNGHVSLPMSSLAQRSALLEVVPEAGYSGGSVFDAPVRYGHQRGKIELGDWKERGLESYSGGVRYLASFDAGAKLDGQVTLDLGRVRGTAEVWINGTAIGARVLSPYRFDMTQVIKPGSNTLEVLVCNTLAPYLSSASPTHFILSGQDSSGLFGPVTIKKTQ